MFEILIISFLKKYERCIKVPLYTATCRAEVSINSNPKTNINKIIVPD
jgi:hypothetical protein